MMEPIIFSARAVSGTKGRHPFCKKFLLQDVDFDLPAGYIMGIIGKNGAGKTTFFDYIMNSKKQYTGQFCLDGRDIHADHLWTLDQIGWVSEENLFLNTHTAKQNAEILGRFYSNFDLPYFEQLLKQYALPGPRPLSRMSRGELMKFQLAFAAAHHPRLFLMDEATAGMDPIFCKDFYRLLHTLLQDANCSVILSTHNEEEIAGQLDYIGLLEQGHFVSFRENELR